MSQKTNVVSLLLVPVRIKGIQLTRTNLDFIFSGKNLFLSVRFIQVFDNRPLINTFKHRNKFGNLSLQLITKNNCFVSSWSQVAADGSSC